MTTYFHGGPRGIWPRRILPPDVTGAPTTADYGADGVCRRDRVYVTTSYAAAAMFAALAPGGGAIYEVVPDGDVEPDPDCDAPDLSFACRSARIVRAVDLTPEEIETVCAAVASDSGGPDT